MSRASVVVGIIAIGASSLSQAQGRSPRRRGAPRDWSHSRLVATRFGPDLDAAIDSDVRTYNKHRRRDLAMAAQAPEPVLDFFTALMKRFMPPPAPKSTAPHLDWFLNTGGYGPVVGDPAKYSNDITTADCDDVIYYTVNQAGSATAANVIAITNPYSTCPGNAGGTTPTVKFALRLTSGTATSAVPSLDGTVLYVLESRASTTLLHAINVDNITTSPGVYDFVGNTWTSVHTLSTSGIGTPTGEQLFQLTFSVINNVSSPYLDYQANQIFFGDSTGKLHRVINTHLSTASEFVTNGFPVTCGAAQINSPVFANNQVIATSANGFAYRINMGGATPYTAITSSQGGSGSGAEGALSAPVVDITNNEIIVTSGRAAAAAVKGIGAFPLMFTAGATQSSGIALGPNDGFASTVPAFDDAFWSTNNGFAYVTGNSTGGGDTYLIKIPYNGTFSAATGYSFLQHTAGMDASVQTTSVTEFLTGSASANKDFLFVGASGGTYSFVNRFVAGFAGTNGTPLAPTGAFGASSGGVSSGIVIDNRTSANITNGLSTANIYFGTKGVGPGTTQSRIVQLNQEF